MFKVPTEENLGMYVKCKWNKRFYSIIVAQLWLLFYYSPVGPDFIKTQVAPTQVTLERPFDLTPNCGS